MFIGVKISPRWVNFLYSIWLCVHMSPKMMIANSVDPDVMLHYAASHLGLHCLQR